MVNTLWLTELKHFFLCRALVLMRLIRAGGDTQPLHSVPNTTANAVCYIHWHYSVVGVTVTLALLEHGPVLLKRHPAPCRISKLRQQTKYSSEGARGGLFFSDVLIVCLPIACCICSWQVMCEGDLSLNPPPSCYIAHPQPHPYTTLRPHPYSSLNAPVGEQRFASCLAKLRPVVLVLNSLMLTQC